MNNIMSTIQQKGLNGLIKALWGRVHKSKARYYHVVKEIVSSGYGLEIGGISSVFKKNGILPIYSYVSNLDNCNFSHTTVWEGDINQGFTYHYDKNHKNGQQFLLEATDLYEIKNDTYDFLLSSHMIEHTANPIKSLKEWIRVVIPGGHLILLIPHKDGTFDHNRPVTTLKHLIQDYNDNIKEDDLTHLDEILKLHDLSMDLEAGSHQEFHERSKKNSENRCLHHHVFDSHIAVELIDSLNLKIIAVEAIYPMHILIVAQKPIVEDVNNNEIFEYIKSYKFNTPFPSDRVLRCK
ncbi:MAG: methyltransferase domain-containing protein [Thiovulaceae bacterium]|nr:methyltransferase domain-containing protein [Sulfurimonadaceae bacterium]